MKLNSNNSMFSDPCAHGVESIEAKITNSNSVVCLTLELRGHSIFAERELYGEFEIYGRPDMRDKFARLAIAINDIFEMEQADARAD